jgi:hypothetical protein
MRRSRFRILLLLSLLAAAVPGMAAELAVIPYRIGNPSSDFPESTGGEYSRILAVAALMLKEDVEVTPPREIEADLERRNISSREVITGEDLDLLGRTRRIDYFLAGSLSRRGGRYVSESVLYSVREGRVIARAGVEDEDLLRLAGREIREALVPFHGIQTARDTVRGATEDVLFLLDLSYLMSADWPSVKEAIVAYASELIDTRRADTRVYIVPFSDRAAYASSSVSENSIAAVRAGLDSLKPAGGAGAEQFMKSFTYALNSIRWRTGGRTMIIISNSSFTSREADVRAVTARKKGILIHAVSLGRIPGDASEVLDRIASANGGSHAHASYHQRLYDAGGDPVEVYMENGRLFKSAYPDRDWKNGLYEPGSQGRRRGTPKPYLDEMFFSEKGRFVAPYTLPESYARIAMARIINQGLLESNIDTLVRRLVTGTAGDRAIATVGRAGRVLVSDGKVSFWMNVPDNGFMDYFENRQKAGAMVLIGVAVKKDPGATYGVSLIPKMRGIGTDLVPLSLRAGLGDIVKRADYYTTRGVTFPPVWFISVRVESAERARAKDDVRDR